MGLSMDARNSEVNGAARDQAPRADWYSLHSGDPGTIGGAELAGGLYTRVQLPTGHPAAANGEVLTDTMHFELPPNATAGWWGRWTAKTGGVFIRGDTLPEQVSVGVSGGGYDLAVRYIRDADNG